MPMRKPTSTVYAAFLALLLALSMAWIGSDLLYDGDAKQRWAWAEKWEESVREIYSSCADCNYPFVGMLVTAGATATMKQLTGSNNPSAIQLPYKVFLAFFDFMNMRLMAGLAALLGVKRPWRIAFAIFLLPCSWAGGTLWAQSDGIVHCCVLLSVVTFTACLSNMQAPLSSLRAALRPALLYGGGVIAGVLGILTKQLFIFAIPGLAILACTCKIVGRRCYGPTFLAVTLLFDVCALGMLFAPDLFLKLPTGYHAHLVYIFLGGGSDHGNVIALYGFNVWVLFVYPDWWQSSQTPILGHFGSPKLLGEIFFLSVVLGLSGPLVVLLPTRWSRYSLALQGAGPDRLPLTFAVLLIGLTYFALNVLMTGTHERYLYEGYPLVLIGLVAMNALRSCPTHSFESRLVVMVAVAGSMYGAYVLAVLWDDGMHRFNLDRWLLGLAVLHALVFIVLLTSWLRLLLNWLQVLGTAEYPQLE